MLFYKKPKTPPKFGFENYCLSGDTIDTWGYTDIKRRLLTPYFKELFPGKKVLDIGAGAGFFSWLATNCGAEVVVNETQEGGLDEARSLFSKKNAAAVFCPDNLIVDLDNQREKFFDYTLALTVIHWLWKPLGTAVNVDLLQQSNVRFQWPATADGLDEVIRRLNFYTKDAVIIDYFRNKRSQEIYQKPLFEERLKANYQRVDVLKVIDEPAFDAQVYFCKI